MINVVFFFLNIWEWMKDFLKGHNSRDVSFFINGYCYQNNPLQN